MKHFYIDLGSSTTKVSLYENKKLELLEEHSIYFKNGFSNETGITSENLNELKKYFASLKKRYKLNLINTHIFATGIFREIPETQKNEIVLYFNKKFNLNFNIISHGIENYYLGKAMEADYNGKKVMVINMGGKTTELVTFVGSKITTRHNLKVGVAKIL